MADKAKLASQQRRGAEAERLLAGGVVKEALDAMEAELVTSFKTIPPADRDLLVNAHLMLLLLERFRASLRAFITSGKLATRELLELEKTGPSG